MRTGTEETSDVAQQGELRGAEHADETGRCPPTALRLKLASPTGTEMAKSDKGATPRPAVADHTVAFEAALAEARGRRNVKLFNALMARHARFGELERCEQAFDALRGLHPPVAVSNRESSLRPTDQQVG